MANIIKIIIQAINQGANNVKDAIDDLTDLEDAAESAGGRLGDLTDKYSGFMLTVFASIQILKDAVAAFKAVYVKAREGADVIGGDVLDAYEDFDEALEDLEQSGKGVIANVMLPVIEASAPMVSGLGAINEALNTGQIGWVEYILRAGKLISFAGLFSSEYRDKIVNGLFDVDQAMEDSVRATEELIARLRALNEHQFSFARAAEVEFDAFIQEADQFDDALSDVLDNVQAELDRVAAALKADAQAAGQAWTLLAQQIAGPFSESAQEFAEEEQRLIDRTEELSEKITDLGGLQYITPENKEQIIALRNQLIGVAMQIRDIKEAYGEAFDRGATGRKVLEAKDLMEELRKKAWVLEQQIRDLGSKPYVTNAQLEKIAELQEAIGETEGAIDALAGAQEEATKRMVFSMLQQQLAVDELTVNEVERLNKLALHWGLIDQATYDAQQAVLDATDAMANDPNLNSWIIRLETALGIVKELEGEHSINFTVTGLEGLPGGGFGGSAGVQREFIEEINELPGEDTGSTTPPPGAGAPPPSPGPGPGGPPQAPSITINATVSNGIEVEQLAHRVAEVIQRSRT